MKSIIEEYSGIILATIAGIAILGIIVLLFTEGNPIGDGFRSILSMGFPK